MVVVVGLVEGGFTGCFGGVGRGMLVRLWLELVASGVVGACSGRGCDLCVVVDSLSLERSTTLRSLVAVVAGAGTGDCVIGTASGLRGR